MTTILNPNALAPGQTIGLLAPASPASEDDQLHMALEMLESLGFRVKAGAHRYRRYGYLAGSDAERAADLNDMFVDLMNKPLCRSVVKPNWMSRRER